MDLLCRKFSDKLLDCAKHSAAHCYDALKF